MRYKSQENAVFIAIHPTTYRGGGFLTHGVLNHAMMLGAKGIFLQLIPDCYVPYSLVVQETPFLMGTDDSHRLQVSIDHRGSHE